MNQVLLVDFGRVQAILVTAMLRIAGTAMALLWRRPARIAKQVSAQ